MRIHFLGITWGTTNFLLMNGFSSYPGTLYIILDLASGSEHFLIDSHCSSIFTMCVVSIFCVFIIRTISLHSCVILDCFS